MMDKQQLLKLKSLKTEAELITKEIHELEFKPREYVADTVLDYRTGRPVRLKIEGYGSDEYIRTKQLLYSRLKKKLLAVQEERAKLEDYIDSIEDPEMRVILRLRFVECFTQEQIAQKVGYSKETIKRRLKNL